MAFSHYWRQAPDDGRDQGHDSDPDHPRGPDSPRESGDPLTDARPNAAPATPMPGLDALADPADTQPSIPAIRTGSVSASPAHPGQLQIDPLTSGPLNQPAHGVPAPAATDSLWRSPKPRPGVKLLIVENEYSNLRLMVHILESAGYDCVTASNGQEALAVFERERPDLMLTDIAMPIMDGLEATAALRARPGGARIPVIGVSAFAMPGDRERALYGGCNAYLTKPYHWQDLLDVVGRLLQE